MSRAPFLAAVAALALAACARSDYVRPDLPLPARYHHEIARSQPAEGAWWTRFGDPAIERLVAAALARNQDLAAAALLVRRAQLQAGIADARRLPPSA